MLTRLSEQERNKVESELAALNVRKCQLEQRSQSASARINQLHQQRDQALKARNSASLLSIFDAAFREQQLEISNIQTSLNQLEQTKERALHKLVEAGKTHQTYEGAHKKEQKKQTRKQAHKTQRQLDDVSAARSAAASA